MANTAGGIQAVHGDVPFGGKITDTGPSESTRVRCAGRHKIPPLVTNVLTR